MSKHGTTGATGVLVWTLESEKHLFVSIGTVVCAVATSRTVDCHAWRERLVHLREKEPECPNPSGCVGADLHERRILVPNVVADILLAQRRDALLGSSVHREQ